MSDVEATQAIPRITRHGRVRIVSKDGLAYNTEITDAESGQQLLRVADVQVSIKPGDVARAHLTLLMPELDVVTDAEMELISGQAMMLSAYLREAVKALEASPDAEQHRELIENMRVASVWKRQ